MSVMFKFMGGSKDGLVIIGDVGPALNPARKYLFLTDGAKLGQRFRELPPEVERAVKAIHLKSIAATESIKQVPLHILDQVSQQICKKWDWDYWSSITLEEVKVEMAQALRQHGIDEEAIRHILWEEPGDDQKALEAVRWDIMRLRIALT
jgi:hypothetical protein